ncbi:hypothetical protein MPTK1_7g06650 [Marchantia polymorpha subsp. ruderalis]|uniref:RRM domain-containing protein n=2 Tax=Marchantia polymorpha TaxID=3197 RepID=A0AAF6BWU5_MARPO|nr:hypothetical protein MARPO_0057s0002 [Marchantia polymorpha]BBN16479.1 hypothetical protein Mp_7g06650 [Marchantia polymorpha subsp. ruderalis]|eukprot:PTQ37358.1 hypothetical protein MARPO_0057s0002 [Marchantia polymorpha]
MGIPTRGRVENARSAFNRRFWFRMRPRSPKPDENSNIRRRWDVRASPCRHRLTRRSHSPSPGSRNESRSRSRGPESGRRWRRHNDIPHSPARRPYSPPPSRHTSGRNRYQNSAEQRGYGHGAEGLTRQHSRYSTCPRKGHYYGSFPPSSLAGQGRSRSLFSPRRQTFRHSKWHPSNLPFPSGETVRSRADAVGPPRLQRSGCSPCSVESGECVDSERGGSETSDSDVCSRHEDSTHSPPKYKARHRYPSSVNYESSTVFVGNLPPQAAERELRNHFSVVGKVLSCTIVLDPRTRLSRGYGFVEMASPEASNRCIEHLNYSNFRGRSITVRRAHRRSPFPISSEHLDIKNIEDLPSESRCDANY